MRTRKRVNKTSQLNYKLHQVGDKVVIYTTGTLPLEPHMFVSARHKLAIVKEVRKHYLVLEVEKEFNQPSYSPLVHIDPAFVFGRETIPPFSIADRLDVPF